MAAPRDFCYTDHPDPHRQRAVQILACHPDIRQLLGRKNPQTMGIILALVALQLGLAYGLSSAPIASVLLVAYLLGAWASHCLFVCIHEACHNLIFATTRANQAASLIANLPTLLPTALSFRLFHLKHHSFMGVEEQDADLPSRWEAKLIGCYLPGKLLWLLGFPVFQTLRTLRVKDPRSASPQIQLNWLLQALFVAWVYWAWGGQAVLYLLASFWFSVGLHPLGARWIQEHWLVLSPSQETCSYYGGLNGLNLNVGYHNEHHDFPSVPWNLLPEIKRRAPEFYTSLHSHPSLLKLFFRFLLDQEISLFSRMVRERQGGASSQKAKHA